MGSDKVLEILDLRKLWNDLNDETTLPSFQLDGWDDDYDDYVCCVGGYSD